MRSPQRLVPVFVTILGALTSSAGVLASSGDVVVSNCYSATIGSDTDALRKAIRVAQGDEAGYIGSNGESCGMNGAITYIGRVYIPPKGTGPNADYLLAGELEITRALSIRGAPSWDHLGSGRGTVIQALSSSLTMFRINTKTPVRISDLQLYSPNGQTSGAAIYITSAEDQNVGTTVERVTFTAMSTGIHIERGAQIAIRGCSFREPRHYGIFIRNAVSGDSGDSTIEGNWIDGRIAGSVGVYQESSGGLRFINNKINGGPAGMAVGYLLAYNGQENGAPRNSSVLIIQGNSIEGQASRGIVLTRVAQGTFGKIIISGNQISGGHPSTSHVGIELYDGYSNPPAPLYGITITGNTISEWQYGIAIHAAKGVAVSGNTIFSNGQGTGIYLNPATPAQSVQIGPNVFFDLATNINGCPSSGCTTCCGN